MSELTKYIAAKRALAEARSVDEVKDVRDKAMAIRLYAQQAKDRTLEEDAIEIRLRAERRLGEMMAEQPKNKGEAGRFTGGLPKNPPVEVATLAQAGIDKNLAHRARKLARMSEVEFEAAIGKAKRMATTALETAPKIPKGPTAVDLFRQILYDVNQVTRFHMDRESTALATLIRDRLEVLLANPDKKENVICLFTATTKTSKNNS